MPKNYQDAITELETVLKQLENNELPLEKSIESFEKGVNLIKYCQKILDETEQKIQQLKQ